MPTDWSEIRVDLKTLVAIVMTVVTGVGVYWGLKSKLDAQAATIQELHTQLDEARNEQKEQARAIIELTVALKVKGVIQ